MENVLKSTYTKVLLVVLGVTSLFGFLMNSAYANDVSYSVVKTETQGATAYQITTYSSDGTNMNATGTPHEHTDELISTEHIDDPDLDAHLKGTLNQDDRDFCAATYTNDVAISANIAITNYIPGDSVVVDGQIFNGNKYPITDASVLVKVVKVISETEELPIETYSLVDTLYIKNDFSMLSNTRKTFEFDWKVPEDVVSGSYQMTFFVVGSDAFDISGDSSSMQVGAGSLNFSITNKKTGSTEIIKNDTEVLKRKPYMLPAVLNYPLEEGKENSFFSCAYNLRMKAADGTPNTSSKKLVLTLKDAYGNVIKSVSRDVDGNESLLAAHETFVPEKSYYSFTLNAEYYVSEVKVDEATISYDCEDFDTCALEGTTEVPPQNIQTIVINKYMIAGSLFGVILLILLILLFKQRRASATISTTLAIVLTITSFTLWFVGEQEVDAQQKYAPYVTAPAADLVGMQYCGNFSSQTYQAHGTLSATCVDDGNPFTPLQCTCTSGTLFGTSCINATYTATNGTYVSLGTHNRCVISGVPGHYEPTHAGGNDYEDYRGCHITGTSGGTWRVRLGDEGGAHSFRCDILCSDNNSSGTLYGYGSLCTTGGGSKSGVVNGAGKCCTETMFDGCTTGNVSPYGCSLDPDPRGPNPTITLTASPTTIPYNTSATLSWTTTDATSCTASGAWSGSKPIGTQVSSTGNITSTNTYTLTCVGGGGKSAQKSVTVNVVQPDCPATTINNCVLPSTAPGASVAGSCSNGYTGSCNYTCNTTGGTWNNSGTNGCVLPATPPATMTGSCPAPGTTATLSWSAVPGATKYLLRSDNQNDGWTGTCTSAGGDWCNDNVTGTSYSYTTLSGVPYNTWVHACNAAGCSSTATAAVFTCIPPTPPTCTSSAASAANTTATSGTFPVYAYGVSANTTAVNFATWGDTGGQDDLIWYGGTNLGGGTWIANVNLAAHKPAPNFEYGNFNVHVYMNTAATTNTWCGVANFTRNYPNCPATTIGTCVLPSTAPGATSVGASCSAGYQGSCSYACNANGTWGGQVTNSCVLTTQCNNGSDNDGDGKVDMADPGCTSSTDNSEADPSLTSASASNCTIAFNQSTCNSTVAWTISNSNSPSARQGGSEFSTNPSGSVSRLISYNGGLGNIMTFHDNTGLLGSRTPTASCPSNFPWNTTLNVCYNPMCSDGLDNDGVQGADFGTDPDCISVNDASEDTDATALELNASPKVVPQGQQTTITWNTHGSNEDLCTITKNGVAVSPNPLTADNGPGDNIETGSFTTTIDAAATYTLTCGARSKNLMISIVSTGFET